MKHFLQLLAVSSALLLPATASRMLVRASSDEYDDLDYPEVCYPRVPDSDTIPPCLSLEKIDGDCEANSTGFDDLLAHAQCMCDSDFFMDWRGCQNCLYDHGYLNDHDHQLLEGVASAASEYLCHGTPTAVFKSVIASAEANTFEAPFVPTGDTKIWNEFPSMTEVSLYYTASGPQGSAATDVSTPAATNLTVSNTRGNGDGNTPSQTGSGTGSDNASTMKASSSTATGGAPAQRTGVAMAIAGAALVVAL